MGLTEFNFNIEEAVELLKHALKEDIGSGDLTTELLVPAESIAKAKFVAKAEGIVAGLDIAARVFKLLDSSMSWNAFKKDGEGVKAGDVIAEFEGTYRAILTGERTALNFLQRMSGIATKTSKFVEAVKDYKTEILDTRKTVPGFRMLDKYAVLVGGGTNHRIGLYDMVMLKENHIRVAGGIKAGVEQVRSRIKPGIKIEVETTNLEEVSEALEVGADIIMLDNMTNEQMARAIKVIAGKAKVEASGSMDLTRVREVAALGVDYISVGALTHSVTALDISQQIYF